MLIKNLNFFLLTISILLCSCSDESDIIPEDPGPITPHDKNSLAEIKAAPPKVRIPLQSRKKRTFSMSMTDGFSGQTILQK